MSRCRASAPTRSASPSRATYMRSGDARDVDERGRADDAEVHHRHEALTAGQHLGLVAELGQALERVLEVSPRGGSRRRPASSRDDLLDRGQPADGGQHRVLVASHELQADGQAVGASRRKGRSRRRGRRRWPGRRAASARTRHAAGSTSRGGGGSGLTGSASTSTSSRAARRRRTSSSSSARATARSATVSSLRPAQVAERLLAELDGARRVPARGAVHVEGLGHERAPARARPCLPVRHGHGDGLAEGRGGARHGRGDGLVGLGRRVGNTDAQPAGRPRRAARRPAPPRPGRGPRRCARSSPRCPSTARAAGCRPSGAPRGAP